MSEGFLAVRTLKRPQTGVLPEVIPKIAALLKYTAAVRVPAFEVQLHPLCLWVFDSDGLVPLFGDALESLVFVSS